MSEPITVVVRRTIRPDATEAFEQWLRGVIEVASEFDGFGGVEVIRPAPGQGQDWVLVFRFDSQEQLDAWNASTERAEWLAKVEPMTVSSSVQTVHARSRLPALVVRPGGLITALVRWIPERRKPRFRRSGAFAIWYSQGESNPCFRRERPAS